MFMVQLGPVVSQEGLYFIELVSTVIKLWTFVYKRSSNTEMFLRTSLRSSHPIFKLGNVIGKFATNLGPAKSDLKSTIKVLEA